MILFDALVAACVEYGFALTDASVEPWHLHRIVDHGFSSVATMVGRLKNRMRQAVGISRIWAEGYYDSLLFTEPSVLARRRYVGRDDGCCMTDGKIIVR